MTFRETIQRASCCFELAIPSSLSRSGAAELRIHTGNERRGQFPFLRSWFPRWGNERGERNLMAELELARLEG